MWNLKPKNRNQVVGCFLESYFQQESMAIHHLNEVTVYLIQRVSAAERAAIIEEKPEPEPEPLPQPLIADVFTQSPKRTTYEEFPFDLATIIEGNVQGPNNLETGEMWQAEEDTVYSPASFWDHFLKDPNPNTTTTRELDVPVSEASRKRARSFYDDQEDYSTIPPPKTVRIL